MSKNQPFIENIINALTDAARMIEDVVASLLRTIRRLVDSLARLLVAIVQLLSVLGKLFLFYVPSILFIGKFYVLDGHAGWLFAGVVWGGIVTGIILSYRSKTQEEDEHTEDD